MTIENSKSGPGKVETLESDIGERALPEPARRALAEAEARRAAYLRDEAAMPREIGGRGGREPGRYGDWEVKGLASDF